MVLRTSSLHKFSFQHSFRQAVLTIIYYTIYRRIRVLSNIVRLSSLTSKNMYGYGVLVLAAGLLADHAIACGGGLHGTILGRRALDNTRILGRSSLGPIDYSYTESLGNGPSKWSTLDPSYAWVDIFWLCVSDLSNHLSASAVMVQSRHRLMSTQPKQSTDPILNSQLQNKPVLRLKSMIIPFR